MVIMQIPGDLGGHAARDLVAVRTSRLVELPDLFDGLAGGYLIDAELVDESTGPGLAALALVDANGHFWGDSLDVIDDDGT